MTRATTILRCIVNADDLGASRKINDTTFDLMDRGRVTSATIMVNAPYFDQIVDEVRKRPAMSFGVHLNLTQFEPLTRDPGLRPLLDEAGAFRGTRLSVSFSPRLLHAIFKEWSAQIDHLQAHQIVPSHIDSHHHAHWSPPLFPVLKAIQRKFRVRKVRISENLAAPGVIDKKTRLKRACWNVAVRNLYRTRTTDYFTDLPNLLAAAGNITAPIATAEIMVHPGNDSFPDDHIILDSRWWQALPVRYETITYCEL